MVPLVDSGANMTDAVHSDPEAKVTVYGAPWCPDCRRSKKFLSEQLIRYNWVDIDQSEAGRAFVEEKNGGRRIIPTIVFNDGSFLVEPSNAELARKLGLQNEPKMSVYDLVVIGGGPCGLTAAIYAAREGIDTLVIERSGLGGQAGTTEKLDNFPGFPEGVGGADFANRLVQQARRFNVEILQAQEVAEVEPDEEGCRAVDLVSGTHIHGYAVLIASGASYRRLGIPGEEDFIGAGVHYCATCDGPFYRGAENVTVIGGGNSATEESLHLLKFVDHVNILVRGPELTASKTAIDAVTMDPRITIRYNVRVKEVQGANGKLSHVVYDDADSETHHVPTSAAFVFIGQQPNTAFLKGKLRSDKQGFIMTGHDLIHDDPRPQRIPFNMETSMPGIFAAGDCRAGSTKQVASAVGEGASAAISIREFLKTI
jgi:thioredoxin reductase (NADPH)